MLASRCLLLAAREAESRKAEAEKGERRGFGHGTRAKSDQRGNIVDTAETYPTRAEEIKYVIGIGDVMRHAIVDEGDSTGSGH